jgi:large subunit ribosomal protein L10
MAITRAKKEEIIKELHQKAEKSKVAVFLNFHGLKVNDTEKLRKNLSQAGIDFKVSKKTLFKIVSGGLGVKGELPALDGEFAVAFGYSQDPEPAKIIKQFVKRHEGLKILGGIFNGGYVLADFIERLAEIPSREILLTRLAIMLNSPISGFVRVIGGPMNKMVGIINQLSKRGNK